MTLLNDLGTLGSGVGNALEGGANLLDRALTSQNTTRDFEQDGFIVPPIRGADGNGLPSSKTPSLRPATAKRHMVHWFVPEIGIVNMYINPQSIKYNFSKLINSERTKGGYILQYWGEELTTLSITGHTGSSGVEGLNVLHEVYRSEQITFDPIGLSLAANNSVSGLGDLVNNAGQNLGGLGGSIVSATTGLFGLDPVASNILPINIPTLGSLAFGIEMYYMGWVFRGYFKSFSFSESAERIGLFEYDINFIVTQRRGYRTNYMPWHRSAIDGPSNNNEHGGIPLSLTAPDALLSKVKIPGNNNPLGG